MKHIIIEKIRFQRDMFAIVVAKDDSGKTDVYTGNFPNMEVGAEFDVDCELVHDPKWGPQYKVHNACHASSEQASPENILLYLESGAIHGCGPTLANKIYSTFGDDSLEIIRNDWNKLEIVPGISAKKAQQIHEGEAAAHASMGLMGVPGITQSKAIKIFATYGQNAMNIIKTNPYQLIYDIDGFAFKTADAIALQNGIQKEDHNRIAGAITFVLYELDKEGHCYCSKKKMKERAAELLEVDDALIEAVLQEEAEAGRVILENRAVYAKKIYNMECDTAKLIMSMANKTPRFSTAEVTHALNSIPGVEIADEQREAVIGALSNNVYTITGGAGTGKTTVINTIAKVFFQLCDDRTVMCAPTGKAARRITESTGCRAMTTARLALAKSEHPQNALIICDEASMLDLTMAYDLVKVAQSGNNQIVFVGDVNQLPPVGAGTFFRDLLESGMISQTRLMICHRQSGVIAENATKINNGSKLSDLTFDNVHTKFVYGNTVDAAIAEYKKAVSKYGVEQVCLLLPFRKARGSVPATSSANFILRPAYNKNKPEAGCAFAKGDRVLNLVNDPDNDIANGDVGTVLKSNKSVFEALMDSGAKVEYPHEAEKHFDLAYALTIHKSQGSEYDCVIVLLTNAAFIMLERNLLYTAVTRGKKEVIMLGDKKAYAIALNTQKAIKRNTRLMERMRALS